MRLVIGFTGGVLFGVGLAVIPESPMGFAISGLGLVSLYLSIIEL